MKTAIGVVVGLIVGAAVMWSFNSWSNRKREIDETYLMNLKTGSLRQRLEFMSHEFGDARAKKFTGPVYDDFRAANLMDAISEIDRLSKK